LIVGKIDVEYQELGPNKEIMSEHTVVKIPCLVVLEGSSVGEVYKIEKPLTVLGRDAKCDITIWEEGVSRQHAQIEKKNQSYVISDLGSTNGTFINGSPATQTPIQEGDKIRLGDILFRFSFQDSIDVSHQENMREMAMRDPLTKVYNRRYFMELMYKEVNYTVRLRQPLTCIMIDIDFFKRINDQHGHPAGDVVLQTVAQKMSKELRVYDAFARYGGEEFVIMLRTTTLVNAMILAERLRKMVENLVIIVDGKTIPVTVSMGVATLNPDHVVSVEDLLKEADMHLYRSKEKGRNRVSSANDKI
jgi:two-component system cell cycle response regulator